MPPLRKSKFRDSVSISVTLMRQSHLLQIRVFWINLQKFIYLLVHGQNATWMMKGSFSDSAGQRTGFKMPMAGPVCPQALMRIYLTWGSVRLWSFTPWDPSPPPAASDWTWLKSSWLMGCPWPSGLAQTSNYSQEFELRQVARTGV